MDLKLITDKYVRSEEALRKFMEEISKVDKDILKICRDLIISKEPEKLDPDDVENPHYDLYDTSYYDLGKEKFSCFAFITLAGGSATRFFSELGSKASLKSKAVFPFTENVNFLDLFAGEILASSITSGYLSPWLIMVSDNTADEIIEYVKNPPFGFPKDYIFVVKQGVLPRFDDQGLPIVLKDGSMIWTGNGHGGVFFLLKEDAKETLLNQALDVRNIKQYLNDIGVEHAVIHNVDNVFSKPTDFSRLGFHIYKNSLFTISAVERKDINEKIGLIVYLPKQSRYHAIEYSFADPRIFRRLKNGQPYYNVGHINTNIFSLDIIEDRYIRSIRPVLYSGKIIEICGEKISTNTVEFLNHMMINVLPPDRVNILLVKRDEFFLPTKTISKEDSIQKSREKYFSHISEKMKRLGVNIPDVSTFELAPYLVFGDFDIFDTRGWEIQNQTKFYFGAFFSQDKYCISEGFKLINGAELFINSSKPFGNMVVKDRKILGFQNPPKVKIGKNVCIRARVKINLEEGSELIIRDGTEIKRDIFTNVRKFQNFVI